MKVLIHDPTNISQSRGDKTPLWRQLLFTPGITDRPQSALTNNNLISIVIASFLKCSIVKSNLYIKKNTLAIILLMKTFLNLSNTFCTAVSQDADKDISTALILECTILRFVSIPSEWKLSSLRDWNFLNENSHIFQL